HAINLGYQEGFEAGQADREDGWGFDYTSSDAYLDAMYGYDGYYVDVSEYQYYFREGFRRGYEDGYYGRYQYGYYSNGSYGILSQILDTILSLTRYRSPQRRRKSKPGVLMRRACVALS